MAECISWRSGSFLKLIGGPVPLALGTIACAGLLQVQPAQALEFGSGEIQGSLDITISHGITYRVKKSDPLLTAQPNSNDGNLNYKRGIVSNTSKFTADLDVGTYSFGAFARVTGFLDFENQNGTRERTPLPAEAKNAAVKDIELLDAYVTAAFDVGEAAVDVRLGKHVLNWGESTFIPNGINATNPVDVSKLRLPGSELREALLPVSMVSASVAATQDLSVEGFYQFDWERTRIDPVGSFFSTTDYAGAGARKAVLTDLMEKVVPEGSPMDRGHGFGPLTQAINADLASYNTTKPPNSPDLPLQLEFDPEFGSVPKGPDKVPSNSGQWGVALRYYSEELGQTEFGFYFMNYHSRLPVVSSATSSPAALQAALAAAGAIGRFDTADPPNPTDPTKNSQTFIALFTTIKAQLVALGFSDGDATAQATEEAAEQAGSIAGLLATERYARAGSYTLEYPDDIKLVGLSFNTVLGASGWALQGEYSFRHDAPLQRAERNVLAEGLAPIRTVLGMQATKERCGIPTTPGYTTCIAAVDTRVGRFISSYTPETVQGYIKRDVSQIQATGTKVLGPMLGADSSVLLIEAALMRVHGMPDEPLESPSGGILSAEESDANATSWGYRVAGRLDYNNAIGAVNLFPYAQFLHDVNGNSPSPSGPFIEGRKALTLGVGADYLSNWQGDVSYTRYSGRGNSLSDRDFISASIKYSF